MKTWHQTPLKFEMDLIRMDKSNIGLGLIDLYKKFNLFYCIWNIRTNVSM